MLFLARAGYLPRRNQQSCLARDISLKPLGQKDLVHEGNDGDVVQVGFRGWLDYVQQDSNH